MLENNPENVQQLFTNQELTPVANPSQRTARLDRQGIAMRMNDIVDLAVRHDGTIGSRVGQEGRTDVANNQMSRQIREYDQRISEMQTWLMRRENHFFRMFSRMEQAMAQSHQQMDSLWAFGGM
jgi:flagellar hook-associated protein 2